MITFFSSKDKSNEFWVGNRVPQKKKNNFE